LAVAAVGRVALAEGIVEVGHYRHKPLDQIPNETEGINDSGGDIDNGRGTTTKLAGDAAVLRV
jgi:hypothetical protein